MQQDLEQILAGYAKPGASKKAGHENPVWQIFQHLADILRDCKPVKQRPTLKVELSIGKGNIASIPWVALLDARETTTIQRGIYCVYLFAQDMSGVALTVMLGVTELKKQHQRNAGKILREAASKLRPRFSELANNGFKLDDFIDLRTNAQLGKDYEAATIAYKFYAGGAIPPDEILSDDLEACLVAYDKYLNGTKDNLPPPEDKELNEPAALYDAQDAIQALIDDIQRQRFVFEPWQIASFVTAVRTKPFVLLAGITGTGKSKLPRLVGDATGSETRLISVRPDWTDSAEVLGYSDLQGKFRPGLVLELAQQANQNRDRYYFCILDEMNLARVEQYFAEVLSKIEDRRPAEKGGFESGALLSQTLSPEDGAWGKIGLPPNLALIGTVNMDESTHSFSRKVLDRAFTIELSDIDLSIWEPGNAAPLKPVVPWPATAWFPRAIMLNALETTSDAEAVEIRRVIGVLTKVNSFLVRAQVQVGYRTRDEVVLFVRHASEISDAFVTRHGTKVDPLDLAINMKVLPRLVGGSSALREALLQFLGWAHIGQSLTDEEDVLPVLATWQTAGRPAAFVGAHYPFTTARLCLMWERLLAEGFTSFWL